ATRGSTPAAHLERCAAWHPCCCCSCTWCSPEWDNPRGSGRARGRCGARSWRASWRFLSRVRGKGADADAAGVQTPKLGCGGGVRAVGAGVATDEGFDLRAGDRGRFGPRLVDANDGILGELLASRWIESLETLVP